MQRSASGEGPLDHEYTSLYATPDRETHLRRVPVHLAPTNFAPPAQPLHIGGVEAASRCFFLAFPCQWGEPDLENGTQHPTPVRQFGTVLHGHIVTYASDGSSVLMGPGDTLLLEDVAPARGHITVNPSADEPCLVHIVQVPG